MKIIEKKKKKKKKYKPILDRIPDWPVYQLSKNRKEFVEEVTNKSVERIHEVRPSYKQLIEDLQATAYREQNRIKRNRWRVDPKDDSGFWSSVKNELVELGAREPEEVKPKVDELLTKIVHRYASEIAGNFKPTSYRFAREVIKFWFARLLNGARIKKFGGFFRNQYSLRDKIHIVGKVGMIRKLARQGTAGMVPTHFSNLDCILIGWWFHAVGLPAFFFVPGLNLFTIKIMFFFLISFGAFNVALTKKILPHLTT